MEGRQRPVRMGPWMQTGTASPVSDCWGVWVILRTAGRWWHKSDLLCEGKVFVPMDNGLKTTGFHWERSKHMPCPWARWCPGLELTQCSGGAWVSVKRQKRGRVMMLRRTWFPVEEILPESWEWRQSGSGR